jgi:hypothetical protein
MQSDFWVPGELGLPDILQPMKSYPSLADSNFDIPLSGFYQKPR